MTTPGLQYLIGGLLFAGMSCACAAQQPPAPAVSAPQQIVTGTPVPLLSLTTLRFLEGTWSATTRDGRQSLGSYTFALELNGTVLARHSTVDAACDPVKQPACGRKDLFYVFQDQPGAPLKAISFDNGGHVVHYQVSQGIEASTSTLGQRDSVVFDSDPAYLGPRVRLRYVLSIDKETGKQSMGGALEVLQPDGKFLPVQEWWGIRL